jgi:hypothetical protein
VVKKNSCGLNIILVVRSKKNSDFFRATSKEAGLSITRLV